MVKLLPGSDACHVCSYFTGESRLRVHDLTSEWVECVRLPCAGNICQVAFLVSPVNISKSMASGF